MGVRFIRLTAVLRKIAEEIEQELRRPRPSDLRLLRLRSLKLAVRQHLSRHMQRAVAA